MGIFAACLLATPACYTLVQHPGIARQNYARPPRDTPCTTCHTRAQLRAYLSPDRLASEREAWERLNHPWWLDARIAADSASVDSVGTGGGR